LSKLYSWNTIQKNIWKTVTIAKKKILMKQMAEFGMCTFRPKSILFQGLENRFHYSILFQYRVGTLVAANQRMGKGGATEDV